MARRDNQTLELPGLKRRVGRPPSGKALTPAQRQAAYRERLKAIPQDVYDAAWGLVVSAIRKNPRISADQAKQIYAQHLREARGAVFGNDGSSTTVIKSQN